MKIARIILRLKGGGGEYAGAGSQKWQMQKEDAIAAYLQDKKAYRERILRTVRVCSARKCEIAILPACAFVYKSANELEDFCAAIPANLVVVTGTLKVKDRNNGDERAVIISKGSIIDTFDKDRICSFAYKGTPIFCSISSSVKFFYDKAAAVDAFPRRCDPQKLLVFDLGHFQYNARYLTQTLNKVRRTLVKEHGACRAVILSFWCFRTYSSMTDWMQPRNELHRERYEEGGDFVDVVVL